MHIEITNDTRLSEIRKVFSDFYPYLQIEFYRKFHKKYEGSEKKDRVDPGITVGELKKTHVSGLLEIKPLDTVADVEKECQQRFGISVQIFRKQNRSWEQTTSMDDFTLKELNEMGRNSSDEFIIEDYEEGIEEGEAP